MDYKDIHKLAEIQYLTGRLDELYKGYVPNHTSTEGRTVDSRISKYEDKLMNLDPIAFHLYKVQHSNVKFSKRKSQAKISSLLSTIMMVDSNDDILAWDFLLENLTLLCCTLYK